MPEPIRTLTLSQFTLLLDSYVRTPDLRRITAVHLHHTWRPRHADFQGLRTVEAMRRVHMEQSGWSDIAQHLTIDPAGGLWTGRSWNARPASQAGRNGTATEGPFMIEMVGDFDQGQDPFDGLQKAAVIEVVATILALAGLGIKALHFHRELGARKSCPGSAIDKVALAGLVDDRRKALKAHLPRGEGRADVPLFDTRYLFGPGALRSAGDTAEPDAIEVPEHDAAAAAFERLHARARRTAATPSSGWTTARGHRGRVARAAPARGQPQQADSRRAASSTWTPGRSTRSSAACAPTHATAAPRLLRMRTAGSWTRRARCATRRPPAAGGWITASTSRLLHRETGPFGSSGRASFGARAVGDLWDGALERIVRPGGLPLWTAMKERALVRPRRTPAMVGRGAWRSSTPQGGV